MPGLNNYRAKSFKALRRRFHSSAYGRAAIKVLSIFAYAMLRLYKYLLVSDASFTT